MWQRPRSADGYLVWALSEKQARADLADKKTSLSEKNGEYRRRALARCDADNPVFMRMKSTDLNPKLEPTGCSERSKSGCHTGAECKHYLVAFSTQATEGTLRHRDQEKLIAVYCRCWKSCTTTTDSQNHHVDPR